MAGWFTDWMMDRRKPDPRRRQESPHDTGGDSSVSYGASGDLPPAFDHDANSSDSNDSFEGAFDGGESGGGGSSADFGEDSGGGDSGGGDGGGGDGGGGGD